MNKSVLLQCWYSYVICLKSGCDITLTFLISIFTVKVVIHVVVVVTAAVVDLAASVCIVVILVIIVYTVIVGCVVHFFKCFAEHCSAERYAGCFE